MLTSSSRSVVLVSLAVALSLSGCAAPFLKRAANTPDPKPSKVVVAGFNVRFDDSGQQKGLLDAAVDAAQNSQLADFGTKATELSTQVLAQHGYEAAWDKARTEKLDLIQIQANSTSAALTGTWRHPESSHWTPATVDGLFTKPADIINKIKVDGQKEYFAFTELVIRDGGMFMKEPRVIVRTAIYDQDAKLVLDLQGIGEGESRFMFSDRSPKNLEVALGRGFESVKAIKEEAL